LVGTVIGSKPEVWARAELAKARKAAEEKAKRILAE
jgi:hypothetical protein